jgi:predicted dehydrogenase
MRVIQLGIGGMGNHWLDRLLPLESVDYVAFVEINEEIAKAQAERHGLDESRIYPSLEAALEKHEADVVVSILPPAFRIETLATCIKHNIPLIAEKPLAENMADAYKQLEMANESGLYYSITQNYRYEMPFQTLKQILDSGELGKIDAVHVAHYRAMKLSGFRAEMPYPLLNDMSIHHCDLMRFLLGSDPISLYGQSWPSFYKGIKGRMAASAIITFPDDVHVSYDAAWGTSGLSTTFNGDWRFDGEKGSLILKDDVITIQKIIIGEDGKESFTPVEERPLVTLERSSQANFLHELGEAQKNGNRAATSIQDNIKSLQMVFDLIESSETGQTIQFNREGRL